jgi:hypothetical protein
MRSILIAGAAAGTLLGVVRFEDPAVKRIETVNFSNLMAPVGTPYIAPGKSKDYYFYGPWVDWADKVTFLGASQTIVEKRPFVTATEGLLRVRLTAPSGTSRGQRDLTIHISCGIGALGGCKEGNLIRKAMVLRVGAASAITPNTDVTVGQPTSFTVTGTGLDVASIFVFRTGLSNTATTSRSANVFHFTGTANGCGSNIVLLRDEAEGGDFYPFIGALGVATSTTCGYTPPPKVMTSCASGTVYDATTKTCVKPEDDSNDSLSSRGDEALDS